MMTLFAVVPATPTWSIKVALIMILCNVVAIGLWRSMVSLINAWLGAIGYEARANFAVPAGESAVFTFNFPGVTLTLPELLAAASFGHLIGAGVILGLSRFGVV